MIKFLVMLLVSLVAILHAQTVSNWQNYTNKQFVNDISEKNSIIWSVSNGGVFGYWPDSSYLSLTKSEGLSSNLITAIEIDNSNKIWLGSSEGYINIYNPETGKINTIYQIFNTDKSIKTINEITISGDTAFVSTAFGLVLINTKDFSIYDSVLKFGNFASETPVYNVFVGSTIFVVTQAGLAYKKSGLTNLPAPETWENVILQSQLPANLITGVTEYNDKIYIASNRGLIEKNNNVWEIKLYSNSEILDIQVQNSSLYTLQRNSIHKFNGTDQIVYQNENADFNKLFINKDNSVLIASDIGTISIDNNNSVKILYPNGPKINSFPSITIDSEGTLWSGTGDDVNGIGVLKFDGDNWSILDKSNTPVFRTNSFHKVSSSKSSVYFSNWGYGFVRFRDNNFSQFDASNTDLVGIPVNNNFIVIDDVKEDDNGNTWVLNFWAANKKPLSVLTNDNQWFHYEFSKSLSPEITQVKNLVIDQYNTKWFGVTGLGEVGLYYFNENGSLSNTSDDIWGNITTGTGLRDKDINALAIDKFGELIIGTSIGVDVIPDPSNPNSIRNDQYFSIRQQTIKCIAVDPINQKWFGTEKGVFVTSSDGSFLLENFTKANSPLPTDNIKSIAIDEQNGIVYVGTDFGVTAISTLFIEPSKDFSNLYAYPNPVTLSSTSNPIVKIDGLVEDSAIKILDISGKLITQFPSIGGRTTIWDCKDSNGQFVSSGVYIIVAFDSEINEVGHTKIAVLRK